MPMATCLNGRCLAERAIGWPHHDMGNTGSDTGRTAWAHV